MPRFFVWVVVIAVAITAYLVGTRVKAAQNVAKKVRRKVRKKLS